MDDLLVEHCKGTSNRLLFEECLALRRNVFIDEQQIDEKIELDDLDEHCIHFVAKYRHQSPSPIVGTCRIRHQTPYVKLERVAVAKDWRGKWIGEQMCAFVINFVERIYASSVLVTQAQISVLHFYKCLGFITVSDEYIEADIPHKTMFYRPRNDRFSQLDIWREDLPIHECIQGECFDTVVISTVKNVIRAMQAECLPRLLHMPHLIDAVVVGRSLLRTLRECALAVLSMDSERSKKLIEFALSLAWEKLNTGHFANVDEAWRLFYTAVSSCKAVSEYYQNNLKEAIIACDMGLIMGRNIDANSISIFAHHIHSQMSPMETKFIEHSRVEPPLKLPNSQMILKIFRPTFETMFNLIQSKQPVIIKGIVSEWVAFRKWSVDYFDQIAGHRTVPVEIGSSYADDGWKQRIMTVNEFIKKFIQDKGEEGPGYLAQHRLFDQIPELLNDISIPDYCAFGSDNLNNVDLNIWLGPEGTISPLHQDPKDNFFCQMDVANPDLEKFPLFNQAHVFDCVLEPGECLYIPTQFWHYVLALDPSISVSCWFTMERDK